MNYLLAALSGFILTLLITPLVRQLALTNNIVDQPGGRRINKQPIPRLGGVAVVVAFWLVILATSIGRPDLLHFTDSKIIGIDRNLVGVLLGALILVTAGAIDDIRGLSPLAKLAAQFLAASCIPLFGIHIQWLAHPFGGADIQLVPWLDHTLIVLWIVGVINVVNWLDGLDGLATGITTIASLILFFLSLAGFVNQPATAFLAIVLFGCGLGFLRFNFNPASIFLGDSGSMFFGFLLAILAVISGGKVATAGLVLGMPILDAAWVILRRLAAGQMPWHADRKHLHHRLLDAGLSQRLTVGLYWSFSGLFGAIALASRTYGKTRAGIAMVVIALALGVVLTVLEKRKKI